MQTTSIKDYYITHIRQIKPIDISLLIISILFVINVSIAYVSSERFFYYWDYGGFQGIAIYIASAFMQAPLQTLATIKDSIHLEYNYYYTVPLIPFIRVFGDSRLSYILSTALIYQIPYVLVIGAIATKLIPGRRRAVFWSTIFLSLFTPIAWAPTLRAYADIGAAMLIALAVWIYLQSNDLSRWWQIVSIGILLGAAILYRRHFAYSVLAFFFAIILMALFSFVSQWRGGRYPAWQQLLRVGGRIALTIGTTLATLLFVGKPFLVRAITTDYTSLYASYAMRFADSLSFFVSAYGWITWLLVGLGFLLGITRRVLNIIPSLFILIFGLISLFQWALLVRQIGIHYTLHITLIIVLGLSAFTWTVLICTTGKTRMMLLTAGTIFVTTNIIIGLTPITLKADFRPIFSKKTAPLTRPDYEKVAQLIDYLRKKTNRNEPIYVVDSSWIMNYDLMLKAEQALFMDQKLNLFVTPQVDSRDYYPIQQLLHTKYVVVTTPFQYHLPQPEEQKVVEVVFKAFTEDWGISQDFVRHPRQFHLANGAVLSIFERTRATSQETAIHTFNQMKAFIGRRPGSQPDWILLNPPTAGTPVQNDDGSYHLEIQLPQDPHADPFALLYADDVPIQGLISGSLRFLNQDCAGARLAIQMTDADGQTVLSDEKIFSAQISNPDQFFEFRYSSNASNLLISVDHLSNERSLNTCSVILDWNFGR